MNFKVIEKIILWASKAKREGNIKKKYIHIYNIQTQHFKPEEMELTH